MRYSLGVMLAAVCLTVTSCTVQTNNRISGEEIGAVWESENTESKSPEQVRAEKTAAGAALRKTLISEEKLYTFQKLSELLSESGLSWEAYYNATGERIDMYWEDGTKLLFLDSAEDGASAESDEMVLVMVNDQFCRRGFEAGYEIDLAQTAALEYYPQTAEYYLSDTELMKMNHTDLYIALNEIYARNGKQMSEPFLKSVFNFKSWYVPEFEAADFESRQEALLNECEKKNVKAITAIQKKRRLGEEKATYKVPRSIVQGSEIDLDEDGLRDRLVFDFIYAGPYEVAKEYMVMINAEVPGDFSLSGKIDEMPTAIYAASLDGKTTQLIMSGKMSDGRPRTDIYSYQNGKATLAGRIDANNLEIMEDCFWAYQYDEWQTKLERAKYIYENGAVVETGITQAIENDGKNHSGEMATLIDSFDFEHSRIGYSEVAAVLKQIGVGWESRLNISGERMELICEDGTELVLMDSGLEEKELIAAGDRLSESGFKRVFIKEQIAEPEDFYFYQTSERLLTGYEMRKMNQTELYIARNEIYARHGRRFEEPFLHLVFSRKSWYKPKYDGSEFSGKADQLFNEYEKKNIKLLLAAERKLAE